MISFISFPRSTNPLQQTILQLLRFTHLHLFTHGQQLARKLRSEAQIVFKITIFSLFYRYFLLGRMQRKRAHVLHVNPYTRSTTL